MDNFSDSNSDLVSARNSKAVIEALGWLLVIFGIILSVRFFIIAYESHSLWSGDNLNIDAFGQFGDYLGGFVGTIFSLAGFLFLYLTFRNQRDSFEAESFQNRFFELLKIHRSNVEEIYFERSISKGSKGEPDKVLYRGKKAFVFILAQIEELIEEIGPFFEHFSEQDILLEVESTFLQEKTLLKRLPTVEMKHMVKLNMAYLIVFFGVDKRGYGILTNIFKEKYVDRFYEPILQFAAMKPVKASIHWPRWETALILWKSNGNWKEVFETLKIHQDFSYTKYYGGHQIRLGHYYRHIFQTIRYVDKQVRLFDYKEKYDFVKTFRSQMSTQEQAVFFFNSISTIGMVWELESHLTSENKEEWFDEKATYNKMLITKYNLIKNIPGEFLLNGIRFEDFYPLVEYENRPVHPKRSEILKYFN